VSVTKEFNELGVMKSCIRKVVEQCQSVIP